MKRRFLLLTVLMVSATTLFAQQDHWHFQIGLGGELKSGNVNSKTLNNTGSVERNDSLISVSAGYNLFYGEKDEEVYDRGFQANLKGELWQYDRMSPFLEATYLTNKFKGFDHKLSLIAGAKFGIYTVKDVCDYSISVAYVSEFLKYTEETNLRTQVSRLSFRVKLKQKLADAIMLKHTSFYQPSIMSVKDFSGRNSSRVTMTMSEMRNTLLNDTGQYLLTMSATTSVPPVLPPYLMIRPMPMASMTPARTGITSVSRT